VTTATAAATADTRKPAGLAAVLAVVLLYCLVHAGFRLLASGNLGEDDPLESLHAQRLLPIYAAPQPPLYDWVLWLVQRWLGTGVAGFLLIKYAALTATAGFLYTAGLRILKERIWAILVVESMALIYQIAWRYHEGFTHEVGAMVAVAATLWAFEKVIAQGRVRDFLLLGLITGLGVMTEMTYWMFLATLLFAALVQPSIRARLADRRLGLAAALAVLIASPYLVALAQETKALHFVVRHSTSALVNAGKGLLDAVRGPLFYLSPLIVLLPMFIPGFLRTARGDLKAALTTGTRGDRPDLERLVLTQALAGIALCILGAVALGASGYAMHRVMPLYLPSVIWLMGVAQRSGDDPKPRRRFAAFAALIAVVALSARLANMFVLDPVCKICRWGMPYAGLAAELRARGFTGEGVVVAPSTELAGNLRRFFPQARFVSAQLPQLLAWPPPRETTWVFVWGDEPPGAVQRLIGNALPGSAKDVDIAKAETVSVPWHHVWRPTGYRSSKWHVLVTDQRSPDKGG
jgi:hypothetical protein